MTSIVDYASLQTYITQLLAREGDTDITTYVPDFIQMCESDLNLNLRAREMITTSNINPSASNKFVPLPDGFLEVISFNDNFGEPLEAVPMDILEELRYASGSGNIQYYALTSQIEFERTAPASQQYPMTYFKELDIATDDTNGILTKYPNLYVYGSAMHAAPFLHDDERLQMWAAFMKQTITDLNNKARRSRRKAITDMARGPGGFNILRSY